MYTFYTFDLIMHHKIISLLVTCNMRINEHSECPETSRSVFTNKNSKSFLQENQFLIKISAVVNVTSSQTDENPTDLFYTGSHGVFVRKCVFKSSNTGSRVHVPFFGTVCWNTCWRYFQTKRNKKETTRTVHADKLCTQLIHNEIFCNFDCKIVSDIQC